MNVTEKFQESACLSNKSQNINNISVKFSNWKDRFSGYGIAKRTDISTDPVVV